MLVPGIYSFKSTIFLYLKCTMVICTYSVHITMAKFFKFFTAKMNRTNSEEAHFMLGKIFSASCRYLLPLKYNILPRKCLVVTSSYSDHVTTAGFPMKKRYFILTI